MFRSLSLFPFDVLKVVVPVLALGALATEAWIATVRRRTGKASGGTRTRTGPRRRRTPPAHFEAKQALVNDLIAGRTTLAEVTAQFMLLNHDRQAAMDVIRRKFPGATDEEKTARNVIAFVDVTLSLGSAIDRAVVRTRLAAELAAMLDPHPSPTRE